MPSPSSFLGSTLVSLFLRSSNSLMQSSSSRRASLSILNVWLLGPIVIFGVKSVSSWSPTTLLSSDCSWLLCFSLAPSTSFEAGGWSLIRLFHGWSWENGYIRAEFNKKLRLFDSDFNALRALCPRKMEIDFSRQVFAAQTDGQTDTQSDTLLELLSEPKKHTRKR